MILSLNNVKGLLYKIILQSIIAIFIPAKLLPNSMLGRLVWQRSADNFRL